MTYDKQILRILIDVGDKGISAMLLAKHVYNQNSTFFFTPDFNEIRAYVKNYLQKNSRSASPLIERTARRGFYRLNTRTNPNVRKLLIEFRGESQCEEQQEKPAATDLSLNLFD